MYVFTDLRERDDVAMHAMRKRDVSPRRRRRHVPELHECGAVHIITHVHDERRLRVHRVREHRISRRRSLPCMHSDHRMRRDPHVHERERLAVRDV